MRSQLAKPSALTEPFWQAAAAHRLVVPRCNRTGRYFFPPERCVPGTDSTDWEYVESPGRGKVYSFSVVERAPSPDFEVPYILAVVDLDEGWHLLTNVIDCAPADMAVGMVVRVRFVEIEGATLPMFAPAG